MQRPEARALWWPRFQRIAAWFAEWEASRRTQLVKIYAEVSGKIEIPINGDRNFILSARADRIEHLIDGRFAVLDYKTGSPPSNKQVRLGLSPQLTLESRSCARAVSRAFPPAHRSASWCMSGLAATTHPAIHVRSISTTARPTNNRRMRQPIASSRTHGADPRFRRRATGLCIARPADVENALRCL